MRNSDTTTEAMQTDSIIKELQMQQAGDAYNKFRLDSMTLSNNAAIAEAELRNDTHNIEPIIGVFIPVIAIIGSLFIVYRSIEAKRAVKMALIEKGMDASLLSEPVNENSRKYAALRYGLLLCGLGLGLIVGLVVTISSNISEDLAVWVTLASATMFGGLGMIVYHLMAKRTEQK